MTPTRAVIFDSDGVLVDSEGAARRALIEVGRYYGAAIPEEDFHRFAGMSDDDLVAAVSDRYGIEPAPEDFLARRLAAFERIARADGIPLFPGARRLLADLKARGTAAAIATSSPPAKVELNYAAHGDLLEAVGALVTAEDAAAAKPAPDLYLEAARRLGVEPANCVAVEDTPKGVESARSAGMAVVAVAATFPREALLRATVTVGALSSLSPSALHGLIGLPCR